MDEHQVHSVQHKNGHATIFVAHPNQTETNDELPFKEGQSVVQKVDWSRRFDHMQHHSGQHLISALAQNIFHLATTSWSLGKEVCYIEFDLAHSNLKEISDETLEQLESLVNEKILASIPVTVEQRKVEDCGDIKQRMEIPVDSSGLIRIVSIGGDADDRIDQNPCCGTHVRNLADIHSVKLLYSQKGKKGKWLVYFIAGGRILKHFGDTLKREKQLIASLK